ncbi:GNAT family N-acetyltransferase [Pararhizobium antarcticum]|uniref:GNAT family acetyltransferase n=1 Tax=Pararhizobium antarcticum TaxID=1798805 RepID=A0A657LZ27_9HYPH|nr:GNAT family N-acetyltransferase [Pararhizobium antarcticum]OJF95187.1 GNAT family acetyltransferase [Rhizobium sp. 58]OJG00772.1 GNAT family acetyltransferase [Pararhizobium antarcticum]
MHTVHTIETERLILRPYRRDDFAPYSVLFANPEVTRFIGGVPFSREQAWTRFLRQVGMWHYFGFGFFALQEKESGHFIGEAGFHDLHRVISPTLEGTMETGWALSPLSHGRGLATEAVGAALTWGDQHFPALKKTCIIDIANQASLRVAAKLHFRELKRSVYHGAQVVLLER